MKDLRLFSNFFFPLRLDAFSFGAESADLDVTGAEGVLTFALIRQFSGSIGSCRHMPVGGQAGRGRSSD